MPEQPTISACILARDEERNIEEALRSLLGWSDQIIVLDNESRDRTAEIARQYADCVVSIPHPGEGRIFDGLRNAAIELSCCDWIFYLDADERVPEGLGLALRKLIREEGDSFEALYIPFRHYFCGKWIKQCGWWPGYTRPQLLKKGRFRYNERLHSGVEVSGRSIVFPAENPDMSIIHYSYESLTHYVTKMNRYTVAEAQSMLEAGQSFSWRKMITHMVEDWLTYYDRGRGDLDGMHGLLLSLHAGIYRMEQWAKLWDLQRQAGRLDETEPDVPRDVRELLEFMLRVAQKGDRGRPSATPAAPLPSQAPLLWHGPLADSSGYADEGRQFVMALIEAGEPVAVAPASWGEPAAGIPAEVAAALQSRILPLSTSAELLISHTLPALQLRAPHAGFQIARTMFETDRLPEPCVLNLNRMDRIWVPSEFNRESFVRSGVDPDKLAVIPGAIDPAPFAQSGPPWPIPAGSGRQAGMEGSRPFIFLSVFDWTLHKGWDVLIESFAAEFGADPAVRLLIKTWSSLGRSLEEIRQQADLHLRARAGGGLAQFPNIYLWQEQIPVEDLPRLYRAVDAFALPTRGEGWGRPLMEAMASGLPALATGWSGLTAFHSEGTGYPVPYQLRPVPEAGAREIPIYAGHYWAEPDAAAVRAGLRRILEQPVEARRRGAAAQALVSRKFSRAAVGALLREELALCREMAANRAVRGAGAGHRMPAPAQGPPAEAAAAGPDLCQIPFAVPRPNPLPREPAPPVDFRSLLGRPARIEWQGDQTLLSSLALVNRELCLGLLGEDLELSLREHQGPFHTISQAEDARFPALFARRGAPLSGPPDVTVRHHFPPNWSRAEHGKLVVIQTWEYGHLPGEWLEGAIHHADEVWAYSRAVRNVYVRSGVPAEKIKIVPLGFDPDIFRPDGPRLEIPNARRIRFLFVGGALDRKGADLLLQAYCSAFGPADDVSLLVKDMGTRSFYRGGTLEPLFRRAEADTALPHVIYLDDDLSPEQLAALYRSADCLVLPYRGEGFGLPPLEAMACGVLPVVTSGGPTDDYTDDEVAIRLPSRRRPAGRREVGFQDCFRCVGDVWQLEPDVHALIAALRWVRDHPEDARAKGRAAHAFTAKRWTWSESAGLARERLAALLAPPPAPACSDARPWLPPDSCGSPARSKPAAGPARSKRSARPEAARKAPEISACLIVRDEEERLAACLRSLRPYVDETVVVDTGSRDATRDIAQREGARVFEMEWPESFAAARNASLKQAHGRWIFWLDADDVMPPETGRKLRQICRKHPAMDAAYCVQVRIPPAPGQFNGCVVDHVKLFPNPHHAEWKGHPIYFEHRIHEQVLPSIRRAGLDVRPSDLYVVHANYDRSAGGQTKKRRRDDRLLLLDLMERPDHPFTLFNLGMTYLEAHREFEVAIQYLRRSLALSNPADSIVNKAYAMLTTAHICLWDWPGAIQANEEGRSHYPEDAELLFQAGQLYQQVGRYAEGREALERLLARTEDPQYRSGDPSLRGFRGRHELALLYRRMGDAPHCREVLQQIALEQPEYLPAQVDLVETFMMLGEKRQAASLLDKIPQEGSIAGEVDRLRRELQRRAISEAPSSIDPNRPISTPPAGASEPDWDAAPRFGRRETILRTLRLLHEISPGPACIVETGTLRNDSPSGPDGDGWSSVAWGWYSSQTGGRFYTVDCDAGNLAVCRRVTAEYAGVIEYVEADSVQFLRDWPEASGVINLLYLDSFDYFDRQASEQHNLAEATAALPHLSPKALVLIDDMSPSGEPDREGWPSLTGKGRRTLAFLRAQGFRLEWFAAGQLLLRRENSAA